jgi:hypothetical protein
MQLHTNEHTDIMEAFEKHYPYLDKRKEPKNLWPKNRVYCDGDVNDRFVAFRMGVSFGRNYFA